MRGNIPCLFGQNLVDGGNDVVHIHAEFFQNLCSGSGEAETVDAHGFPLAAQIFPPEVRDSGFYGNSPHAGGGKHAFPVFGRLRVKAAEAWHGDDPDSFPCFFRRFQSQFQFGTAGKNNGFQGCRKYTRCFYINFV